MIKRLTIITFLLLCGCAHNEPLPERMSMRVEYTLTIIPEDENILGNPRGKGASVGHMVIVHGWKDGEHVNYYVDREAFERRNQEDNRCFIGEETGTMYCIKPQDKLK